jgi:hypothetical protein
MDINPNYPLSKLNADQLKAINSRYRTVVLINDEPFQVGKDTDTYFEGVQLTTVYKNYQNQVFDKNGKIVYPKSN